jgi:hypothetical protein
VDEWKPLGAGVHRGATQGTVAGGGVADGGAVGQARAPDAEGGDSGTNAAADAGEVCLIRRGRELDAGGGAVGRGLHSSSSQLNLSRF